MIVNIVKPREGISCAELRFTRQLGGITDIASKKGNTGYSNYLNKQFGTTFKNNYSDNAKKNEGIKLGNQPPSNKK